jgi:high-affinity nickel permease
MNDTIQYDTSQQGQFIPEQKTDYIYTTTSVKGDIITAFIAEAFYISLGIANVVFLILIWRKLKKIEKKLG